MDIVVLGYAGALGVSQILEKKKAKFARMKGK